MRPEEAIAAERNMLKFLTYKLRTHSLNEDQIVEKVDGRDSGTESDDEVERTDVEEFGTDGIMKWNYLTDIKCGESPESGRESCSTLPPAGPLYTDLLYDHHSSEEELEVINGAPSEMYCGEGATSRRRGASSPGGPAPEKRKWGAGIAENDENAARADDDDDDDTKTETPVRFRTSPPLEALKPRRGRARGRPLSPLALHNCPCSEPPHKLALLGDARPDHTDHDRASPRKRTRHARRHRPCLDFDKMQQLRMRGVTSWRHHGGSHSGGELSVFCW